MEQESKYQRSDRALPVGVVFHNNQHHPGAQPEAVWHQIQYSKKVGTTPQFHKNKRHPFGCLLLFWGG